MLVKTPGIVLSHVDYGESSIVVQIYTLELGRQSYLVNSVRSTKKKSMLALLQPLTILDMEVYHKSKRDLHRIKELTINTPFRTIPFHPVRRTLAFFITEVLTKAVREEMTNPYLFDYLAKAIMALDEGIPGEYNFHLYFMMQLSRFIGFFPQTDADAPFFDLRNGRSSVEKPAHSDFIEGSCNHYWNQLASVRIDELESLKWNSVIRRSLIDALESFYQLHIPGFSYLKSHHILQEVL